MNPPAGRIYPLADRLLDGRLAERLREWRAAGESFRAISIRLHHEGIDLAPETVRVWCHNLGIEDAA